MEIAMQNHGTRRERGFDAEKALASIWHLVHQTKADLYAVMKMLYLADKTHLGKYGRTITGDDYVAMPKGPVPDHSYALCKFAARKKQYYDHLPSAREFLRMDGNEFKFLAQPDVDVLSISEERALDDAAGIYQAGGWKAVFDASHDSAWRAAWADAKARGTNCTAMDLSTIVASMPNAPELMEYLSNPHADDECDVEPMH